VKLKIWQAGEAVLRSQSRPLTPGEIRGPEIQELIASMRDTMRDAPGVGLAAPQIGLDIQLVVIEDRPEYIQKVSPAQIEERQRRPVPFHVLINPSLTFEPSETFEFFEGCLSVAGFTAIVPRAGRVRVEYLNEAAESREVVADGWYARILQHEIDHLQGTLYIDRMQSRSFSTTDNYMRYLARQSEAKFAARPDPARS
jgi:peptide deformylase